MLGSPEKLEGRLCLLKCLTIDLVGTAAPEVLQGSCGLCQEKKERKRCFTAMPGLPWTSLELSRPHSALGGHL